MSQCPLLSGNVCILTGCGGFWLDAGELAKIRSLFKTEQEREKAAEEYFSEIFGDQLDEMKAGSEAKAAFLQLLLLCRL